MLPNLELEILNLKLTTIPGILPKLPQPNHLLMKSCLLALSLLLCSFIGFAQQNALDFDGFDDYANVPSASALIANQPGFSMSCWVYPTNPSPAFPNFDGVIGFRNELNADFYILQLSATGWECRLRNSSNQVFTLASATVQLNTWQHVALVYTGSALEFYHNGTLATSMPANGTITNTGVDFNIGRIPFQSTPFQLTGKVDDAALWSKALSAAEVNCIYKQAIPATASGLVAHYPMNQGIAGGNNSTAFFLDDVLSVTYDGYLNGLALTGATSNFVAGISQMGTLNDTICAGDSVVLGGQSFKTNGSYRVVVNGPEGCDSTVVLNLTVDQVNNGISQLGPVFTATDSTAAAYQWVNCAGFTPIAGANSRNFTASANGQYAVIVTNSRGCSDTSVCLSIATIGIAEQELARNARVYPNPGKELQVEIRGEMDVQLEIRSITGQLISSAKLSPGEHQLHTDKLGAAVYILYFSRNGIHYTSRWVKQP